MSSATATVWGNVWDMSSTETFRFYLVDTYDVETLTTADERDAWVKWAREDERFAYFTDEEGRLMDGDLDALHRPA